MTAADSSQAGQPDPLGEAWLPIPGYEGRYDVSDQGRVRSWLAWRGRDVPRLRTPMVERRGYLSVTLRADPPRPFRVHCLVAAAFLGPRPPGMEIRHLNGDALDNRKDNLTYGTRTENALDAITHGRHPQASRTHCKRGHPFDAENTRWLPRGRGRQCRACARINSRRRKQGKQAAA